MERADGLRHYERESLLGEARANLATLVHVLTESDLISVPVANAQNRLVGMVTRLPVVRDRKLVGIVARRDLLHGYMKASEYWS